MRVTLDAELLRRGARVGPGDRMARLRGRALPAEARESLREAVALVLEANRELAEKSLAGQEVTRERFELPAP